jgi:D-3-phosphoglycerate dehydrogenase
LAQFKIVTPKGTSFAVAGGGYEFESEALEPLGPSEIDATSENASTRPTTRTRSMPRAAISPSA